jgi:hypothetical protein
MVRCFFPSVRIRVRLDGGFAHPDLLDFLDAEPKLEYVVAMANNQVLERKAEQAMQFARSIAAVTGGTEQVYDDANYAARSWPRERRVIIKAEVVWGLGKEPKDNPRFVITNMKQSPQWLYEKVYCQRGDIENRIKELQALHIDRTSCTRFWSNQFRVLLTAAAYVLMQELRLRAADPLRARPGLDAPRTVAETWRPRRRFGPPHGAPSARLFPLSRRLPQSGEGTRRLYGITQQRYTEALPRLRKRQMSKAFPKTLPASCPANAPSSWACKYRHQNAAETTFAPTWSTKTPWPKVSRIMRARSLRS